MLILRRIEKYTRSRYFLPIVLSFPVVAMAVFSILFYQQELHPSTNSDGKTVVRIRRSTIDLRKRHLLRNKAVSAGNIDSFDFKDETIANQIYDIELVKEYAKSKKIMVSREDIDKRLEQSAKSADQSLNMYIKVMKSNLGLSTTKYYELMELELLKEKVQADLKQSLSQWLIEQKKNVIIEVKRGWR